MNSNTTEKVIQHLDPPLPPKSSNLKTTPTSYRTRLQPANEQSTNTWHEQKIVEGAH